MGSFGIFPLCEICAICGFRFRLLGSPLPTIAPSQGANWWVAVNPARWAWAKELPALWASENSEPGTLNFEPARRAHGFVSQIPPFLPNTPSPFPSPALRPARMRKCGESWPATICSVAQSTSLFGSEASSHQPANNARIAGGKTAADLRKASPLIRRDARRLRHDRAWS